MNERYSRALAQTGAKIAEARPGLIDEGYWIDAFRYFFLSETRDAALGIVSTPSLIDRRTGEIRVLLTLETIVDLISSHSGRPIDPAVVARARLDWAGEGLVGLSVLGNNYVIDSRKQELASVESALEQPALYSPDGRYACFIRGYDLWLYDRETRTERSLTSDGAPQRGYGQTTEASVNPISYRKRPNPYGRWSPDSQWFLTSLLEESHLPDVSLIQHAPPGMRRSQVHTFKYCMAGDPAPQAIFVAIHVRSGRMVRLDEYPVEIFVYSPFNAFIRSVWFETSQTAWFVRTDRYSKRAELIRFDLQRGTAAAVYTEEVSSGYLELNTYYADRPNVWTLSESGEFIWYSERDGWGHLYLHDSSTGKIKSQITKGEWLVRRILHVDPKARKIVFSAHCVDSAADPAHRTVCSANFDGSGFEILLSHKGDVCVRPHDIDGHPQESPFRRAVAGLSPDGKFAIARFWSVESGNTTELVDLSAPHPKRGQVISALLPDPGDHVLRPFTALAADGVTRLHGVMFLPRDFDEQRTYALIDYIYPGPAVGHTPQSYLSMRASHNRALAELGFISIMMDSRRMAFRQRALHQLGYGQSMLEPQLADHAAVVRQLCDRYRFIDKDRIGIFGTSAGGTAAARAMFDYGDVFKVGVAVVGAHDQRCSIAHWTERHCGPFDAEAWFATSNLAVAHKLAGKLLLIQGEMDENVHFSHMLKLVDALIRANRDFDMLVVPNEGHRVITLSGYAQRRLWDYFVQHLLGERPPKGFELTIEPWAMERATAQGLMEIE